ncbi:MAG TPA: hypothetical protein VFZ70_07120 [Euzebyales bacterium]
MARSQRTRTTGNIMQQVGRMLSGGTSGTKAPARGRRTTRPDPRRRRSANGKGLLRRLLR